MYFVARLRFSSVGRIFHFSVDDVASDGAHNLAGFIAARPQLFPFVLIWTAHIGIDRLLAFGLKYPTHFSDTHLQHV